MRVKSLLAMFNNRIHRQDVYTSLQYWNAKALEYDGSSVSMWPNQHLNTLYHHIHAAVLQKYLSEVSGWHILDVGCGIGRISQILAKQGAKVVGIDFSSETVNIARKISKGDNPVFRTLSVYEINEDAAYEAAIMFGVACVACRDAQDLREVLQRIYKALKPGGVALFFEPLHTGFLKRVLSMSDREFVGLMTEIGYEVRELHHLHFWPIHLVLASLPWPRWVTSAGFYLGQLVLKLLRGKAMGDYKFIFAMKSM